MRETRTFGICGVIALAASVVTVAAPPQRYAPGVDRMTGTYQPDSTRGDSPQRAAEAATRSSPPDRGDRVDQNLTNRPSPPTQLPPHPKGRPSRSPVHGSARDLRRGRPDAQRTLPNGRAITTLRTRRRRLSVSTSGSRGSDFSVTFEALDNGDRLHVTRRLDNEEPDRPITIQSFYHRVSDQPRWDPTRKGRADAGAARRRRHRRRHIRQPGDSASRTARVDRHAGHAAQHPLLPQRRAPR